jgi:O-antigen ligase
MSLNLRYSRLKAALGTVGRSPTSLAEHRRPLLPADERIGWGVLLGVGAAASGFTPINHLDDVLQVTDKPLLGLLLPPVLLAVCGAIAAVRLPASAPTDRLLASASCLLLFGGALSLSESHHFTRSALLLGVTIGAPLTLLWSLRRSDVSKSAVCAAFLGTACLFLLRSDLTFLVDYGLPNADSLFQAKFSNRPYDFHYNALGNPDQTALFLVLMFPLAALWASQRQLTRLRAALLLGASGVLLLNLGLVYVRSGMAVGLVVALVALAVSPLRLGLKFILGGTLIAGVVVALATSGAWQYVRAAADVSNRDASAVARATSYKDGFRTMLEHPVTGLGIGEYGSPGQPPAHSSLVQAGAELGLLGAVGILLIFAWLTRTTRSLWRQDRLSSVAGAACLSAALYWVYAMVFGGANVAFGNGFVAIWGVGFAIVVSCAADRDLRTGSNYDGAPCRETQTGSVR